MLQDPECERINLGSPKILFLQPSQNSRVLGFTAVCHLHRRCFFLSKIFPTEKRFLRLAVLQVNLFQSCLKFVDCQKSWWGQAPDWNSFGIFGRACTRSGILPTGLIPKTTRNYKPLCVPNPKIPMKFRHKPNPTPKCNERSDPL